jgi:hypothetical protein
MQLEVMCKFLKSMLKVDGRMKAVSVLLQFIERTRRESQ